MALYSGGSSKPYYYGMASYEPTLNKPAPGRIPGTNDLGLSELFFGKGKYSSGSSANTGVLGTEDPTPYSDNRTSTQPNASYVNYSTNPNSAPNQLRDLTNTISKQETDLINTQTKDLGKEIDNYYKPTANLYNQRLGELGGQEQQMLGLADQSFQDQTNLINRGSQQQLASLGQAQNEVDTRQRESFRNVDEDVRNALDSANVRLGVGGASDSSARGMYAYAIGKQGSKNRTNLLRDFNNQRAEIDLNKQKVEADTQSKLEEAQTWLANKRYEVSQYVRQLRNELQGALSDLDRDRAKARIENVTNAYNNINGRMQQFNNMYLQMQANLLEARDQRVMQLENYGQQLAQDYGFNPSTLATAPIDAGEVAFGGGNNVVPIGSVSNEEDRRFRLGALA